LLTFIKKLVFFYNDCKTSRTLIGLFLLSTMGQTHELIIYAMRQRARADKLTVCYCKETVVFGSTWLSPRGSTATLTVL